MRARRSRRALLSAAMAAGAAGAAMLAAPRPAHAQAATQAQVIVYRCIGPDGGVSLRDTPCPKGERQEARTMARPTDAPPPAPAAASAPDSDDGASGSATERAPPRIVVVREPAPAPMYECTTPDNTTYTSDSPEGNPRWVPMWTFGWPVAAGTWVRDTCRAMPQAETCARLRDRRAAIERRFFNAMPSERARLEVEERGVDARLDADCGGH